MTHEEIKILISAYCDGEVTPSEKVIVEEHLSTCESCKKDLKMYQSMSSSLSRWPDESLSPDAAIKVQQRIEQRRESMFTQRNLMALGTTLALTIIVGSVFYHHQESGFQGRLKRASDDIARKYSSQIQYEPYYLSSNNGRKDIMFENKSLGQGIAEASFSRSARMGEQSASYSSNLSQNNNGRIQLAGLADIASKPMADQESNYYQTPSSSYYDALNVDERKKIQRADLSLQVDNAFKTKSQLTDLILQFNGIIVSSEFSRSDDGAGRGTMVCKVYPKDLEHALGQIRKLGEVENENETSSDVTDQYNKTEDNISKYSSEKDRLQKTLNGFKLFNPTTDEERENTQRQIAQTTEEIRALENMIKGYQEQTSMSVIVINFYDVYKNTLKANDDSDQWKSILENKWKTTRDASLGVFANILFGVIFLLSYIVPVLIWCIIFVIIYSIVRIFFKK